jgi:glutaminyl-tRNA synthetase
MGVRKILCSREMLIERRDVRVSDEKDYFGLAPGKRVALKYLAVIECEKILVDSEGNVNEVVCRVISKD